MKNATIKLKFLRDNVPLPVRATPGSGGFDVFSTETFTLYPNESYLVPLGFAIALPPGHVLFAIPRSGLALHNGITVANSPGLIDEDYRGEVGIILRNDSHDSFRVKEYSKIAQLLLVEAPNATFEVVEELDATARGVGGFGHTGV